MHSHLNCKQLYMYWSSVKDSGWYVAPVIVDDKCVDKQFLPLVWMPDFQYDVEWGRIGLGASAFGQVACVVLAQGAACVDGDGNTGGVFG